MSLAPGALVSHYRLVRQLGAGGMGEVHLAQDLQLDRQVAIKFLTSPDDHLGRKRLLNEARAAASLDHQAICAVYEVGSDPVGGDFIVMQYVEGEPLSARLRRGRLTSAEAIAICLEIADGLRAAHRRGVIHRDLKPQNIIITPSGHPKLLDFGIAKRTAPARSDAATDSVATQPDDKMGTPAYMAPEQVRGYAVDFRTDLFAFGCVLFECLTGRRAFSGPTSADIQSQVLSTNPPPPSAIAPELSVAYDALCARLLHKEPAQRMQSADELVGALQALSPITGSLSGRTPSLDARSGVRAAWSVRQKTLATITAIAAIVIVASSWWWYRGRDLPTPPEDARIWYEQGVAALREGTYFGAKTALEEAVRVFPAYAEAWSRLAEAYAELDDEASAQAALLRVSTLVPDSNRLRREIRLRLNAVRFSVLRDRDAATAAYQTLVEARPDDEGAWVDLGRAHEASGQMALARENYTKALAITPLYAEAHLRLGALPGLAADKALREIDEAIREYRIGMKTEGECEALLRKGIVLAAVKRTPEARDVLNQVVALGAADARFTSQRLRAQFELTRLTAAAGQFSDAKALGQRTVDEAMKAGLQRIAANGLIDLAGALINAHEFDEADRTLVEAIAMSAKQGARLTEMRGRLQRASGRLAAGREEDAIALCAEPLTFFGGGRNPRFEASAKNILSRAHENLGRYDEASRLTAEVLKFAEGIGDDAQIAVALENLAGQYTKRGRLPEALEAWVRVEQLHTKAEDHSALRRDLTFRAELLVLLGRGDDATKVLDEIERRMKGGNEAYADRGPRIALLRALLAATQGRFAHVAPLAEAAGLENNSAGLVPLARILREYARAQSGVSVEKPRAMVEWAHDPSTHSLRPDFVYWTARTLIARRENRTAYQLVTDALTLPSVTGSLELTWRLTAVAAVAARGLSVSPDSAAMAGRSEKAADDIDAAWHDDARRYFARPDLTALRPNRS